jgi:hypothetical protein
MEDFLKLQLLNFEFLLLDASAHSQLYLSLIFPYRKIFPLLFFVALVFLFENGLLMDFPLDSYALGLAEFPLLGLNAASSYIDFQIIDLFLRPKFFLFDLRAHIPKGLLHPDDF